jgi:hypothetical protein
MGALPTVPRGVARGNVSLHDTIANAPAYCYGSCGRRTFAQSLYHEYISWRTAGISARIRLGHAVADPFWPHAPGLIYYLVGGSKIKQFPCS